MHTLIVGRTEMGKSAMAKNLGSDLRLKGEFVAAYNPTSENGYTRKDKFGCAGADIEFDNPDEFGEYCGTILMEKEGRKFIIVDEAHEFFTRAGSRYLWLAQKGRHYGINIIGCTQRGAQVHPTFRSQCGRLYLFACSLTDAKFLADEYGRKELQGASALEPGEYFKIERNTVYMGRLF